MIVKFKKLHPNAEIPERGSVMAGGWDVFCTEVVKESDDFVICKLGFALQPPSNYKVTLVPRSSLTKTKWILQNMPGLGDPDYIGEYQYRFRALPTEVMKYTKRIPAGFGMDDYEENYKLIYPEFPYQPGDRVGQIYLEEIIPIEFELVEELDATDRGMGGFGSTGK